MPLDSDVFRVPPGYNAPQQVSQYGRFSLLLFIQDLSVFFECYMFMFGRDDQRAGYYKEENKVIAGQCTLSLTAKMKKANRRG